MVTQCCSSFQAIHRPSTQKTWLFITSFLLNHSIGTYRASWNLSSLEMYTKSWKTCSAMASWGSLLHRPVLTGVIKTGWRSFPPNTPKRTIFSYTHFCASLWQVWTCQLVRTLVWTHTYTLLTEQYPKFWLSSSIMQTLLAVCSCYTNLPPSAAAWT